MISYRIKFFNYLSDISQTKIIFSFKNTIFLRINDDIICSKFNFQLSHKVQNGLFDDKVKHFGEAN